MGESSPESDAALRDFAASLQDVLSSMHKQFCAYLEALSCSSTIIPTILNTTRFFDAQWRRNPRVQAMDKVANAVQSLRAVQSGVLFHILQVIHPKDFDIDSIVDRFTADEDEWNEYMIGPMLSFIDLALPPQNPPMLPKEMARLIDETGEHIRQLLGVVEEAPESCQSDIRLDQRQKSILAMSWQEIISDCGLELVTAIFGELDAAILQGEKELQACSYQAMHSLWAALPYILWLLENWDACIQCSGELVVHKHALSAYQFLCEMQSAATRIGRDDGAEIPQDIMHGLRQKCVEKLIALIPQRERSEFQGLVADFAQRVQATFQGYTTALGQKNPKAAECFDPRKNEALSLARKTLWSFLKASLSSQDKQIAVDLCVTLFDPQIPAPPLKSIPHLPHEVFAKVQMALGHMGMCAATAFSHNIDCSDGSTFSPSWPTFIPEHGWYCMPILRDLQYKIEQYIKECADAANSGEQGNSKENRESLLADIHMLLGWMRCYKEVLMVTLDEMGKSLIKEIEELSCALPPEEGTYNAPPST